MPAATDPHPQSAREVKNIGQLQETAQLELSYGAEPRSRDTAALTAFRAASYLARSDCRGKISGEALRHLCEYARGR